MLKRMIYFTLVTIFLLSSFAIANTAPQCSAVFIFNKSEVEAKVLAIAQTVTSYQTFINQGLTPDKSAYSEAIEQIQQIVNLYPEMISLYFHEMERIRPKDSSTKKGIKESINKEKVLQKKFEIDPSVVNIKYNSKPHLIARTKENTLVILGEDPKLIEFIKQQKNVKKIIADRKHEALAVLLNDGTVVTWREPSYHSIQSSQVDLTNIKNIFGFGYAFVAEKNDGTFIHWGQLNSINPERKYNLSEVKMIAKGIEGLAVLQNDGTVLFDSYSKDPMIQPNYDLLTDVESIYTNGSAYAALKKNGTVITWGSIRKGGDSSHLNLTDVKAIFTNTGAFAALKNDHTVVTWGNPLFTGELSKIELTNIKTVYANSFGFYALKYDGTVLNFGDNIGSKNFPVGLSNVKEIFSTEFSSVALKNDGTVVNWGSSGTSHSIYYVQNHLYDITHITPLENETFLAHRKDGKYIIWGEPIGHIENQILDFGLF